MAKREPGRQPAMSRASQVLIALQVVTVLALLWLKGGQLF